MVATLKEIDTLGRYAINQAMLLSNAPRPYARAQPFERFGFADAPKRIAGNGFDQLKNSQRNLPVGLDPVSQVLTKVRIESGQEAP